MQLRRVDSLPANRDGAVVEDRLAGNRGALKGLDDLPVVLEAVDDDVRRVAVRCARGPKLLQVERSECNE
jgi:hypothetical protein